MHKVFVSYRRSDSSTATGRIYDHLTATFGQDSVFKDIDSIALGDDFRRAIGTAVGDCRVLLAIIGDGWLEVTGEGGKRRLDEPDDYVRIEVESALARGIPVIPVLVGERAMPRAEELPASLRELAFRNGIRVRPDPDFKGDMDRVSARIRSSLTSAERATGVVRSLVTRRSVLGVTFAAVGVGAALFLTRSPAAFEIVDKETGQLILREFKLVYHPKTAGEELASAKGFGGKCVAPGNFSRIEAVECYGYDFISAEGNRLILGRDKDEFEKAIRPVRDTYDVPTPTDFELAQSSKVDLDDFALTVKNETSDFVDLVFLYHDPREGALVTDSWELVEPPIQPQQERKISGFHRQPGYFVIFASSHGRTGQHLISANLYSGKSPKLKVVVTADGLGGRLTW